MRAALFSPVKSSDDAIGPLAETAIFSQWFHNQLNTLYYARWPEGEVDIVSLSADTQKAAWAVEVKWSDRYCDRLEELQSVINFCHSNGLVNVMVTSKSKALICKVDDVTIEFVPASLYCYTVGFNAIHSKPIRDAESRFVYASERM
jgi:uncharacterized protein